MISDNRKLREGIFHKSLYTSKLLTELVRSGLRNEDNWRLKQMKTIYLLQRDFGLEQ